MANISTEIVAIQAASRGEEVRDAIVSALEAINAEDPANALPTPTAADSGKYLRVNSSGAWVLATVPNAEEVSF